VSGGFVPSWLLAARPAMEDNEYFFAPPESIANGEAWIRDRDECRHLVRVLRKRPGDRIVFADGNGWVYEGIVRQADLSGIRIVLLTRRPGGSEPRTLITLVPAMLKGSRLDTVIEKTVELGIAELSPVWTARTVAVVKPEDREQKRIRWERIALSAMKQSLRTRLPRIAPATDFIETLRRVEEHDLSLIAHEGEDRDTPDTVIARSALPERVLVFTGPEGGFTPEEIIAARRHGVFPVSLGPRRLRADTASIVMVTQLMTALKELEPARKLALPDGDK